MTSAFFSRLVVTAAGLPIVLGAAWLGNWTMLALLAVASLVAQHELYRVGRSFRPLVLAGYGGTTAALLGVQLGGLPWMAGGALLALPLAFLFAVFAETRQSVTVAISFTTLGTVWIGLGLGHLVLVREIPEHGRLAIFTVLLTVFATDTAAYLVGRLVGRHKLAPAISPGKSWEGFVAGTVAGLFTSFVALYKTDYLEIWESLVLGGVVVLASVVGDLLQSLVKRDIGVKDTGRLLAGHGGMFDRIDSLLVASPAAFYCLLALGAT
jgi:phosphatidate cytidylyltransferase